MDHNLVRVGARPVGGTTTCPSVPIATILAHTLHRNVGMLRSILHEPCSRHTFATLLRPSRPATYLKTLARSSTPYSAVRQPSFPNSPTVSPTVNRHLQLSILRPTVSVQHHHGLHVHLAPHGQLQQLRRLRRVRLRLLLPPLQRVRHNLRVHDARWDLHVGIKGECRLPWDS